MRTVLFPVALAVVSSCLSAQAQTMKPGLWEINQKMQSSSGEMEKGMADMQKQMAAMPAEQRKMMQDMLAKQGVGMGAGPAGMSIKVCMTREMIERNEIAPQEGDCKSSYAPRVGNTMKMSFVCTKPPSKGEGQVSFVSAEAYTSKMTVTTQSGGRNEQVTMDGQGKWLSAECGAIKPLAAPKK
jgi:hypothetical protein